MASAIEPLLADDSLSMTLARSEVSDTELDAPVTIESFVAIGTAIEILETDGQIRRIIGDTIFVADYGDYNDDGIDDAAWRYQWVSELSSDELPRTKEQLLGITTSFLRAVADHADVTETSETPNGREFAATIPAEVLAETAVGQQIGLQPDAGAFLVEVLSTPDLEIALVNPDPGQPSHVVWVRSPSPADEAIETPARRLPASSTFDTTCLVEDQPNSFGDTSCANFHELRIFASHRMPEAMSRPDFDEAERRCLEILTLRNDGAGLKPPADEVTMAFPSDAQWDLGRRQVECFVSFLEPVRGPLNDLTLESASSGN